MAIGDPVKDGGRPISGEPETRRSYGPGILASVAAFVRRYPGFIVVVVIPSVLAILYYGLVESNIYSSTAQILVKSANQNSTLTGLGSFLQSTGITTTPNDAYTVNSYLTSRDALAELEKNPNIRAIYARPGADFINRFPNLIYGPSFQNLFIHYNAWITVDFDTSSNITTITVNAFRPGDAHAIAERLLVLTEADVNHLNDRVRDDALRGARKEVSDLQQRSTTLQNQITAFRQQYLLLDPTQTSTLSVSLLSSLESDLVTTRAALSELQRSAPGSPHIPALRAQITALEGQVAAEENKGASGSQSLAPKISEYQQLLVRQQFLQLMLQSAAATLEVAEATVQQQQLYIARVAEPSMPDWPLNDYLNRSLSIVIVIFTALLIYWIGRMMSSVIKDHLDRSS